MLDVSSEEITDGSLVRALLLVAAPLFAQNLTQVLQQVIDVFWVGRLGATAVAAVGLTFPVVSIFTILVSLTPYVGTQVLVSQRVGSEDPAGARRATVHGMLLGVAAGVVVAAVGVLAAGPIVGLLGAGPAVRPLAATYLSTYVLLLPFAGVSDALEGAFTGSGDSRAALYVTLLVVATNVVLDPVFVLGFGPIAGMGVRGAALATVLGTVAGLLLAAALTLGPRESLNLTLADATFDRDVLRRLLDVGAPLTGQRLAQDSVRVLLVSVVATAGGAAGLAAYTIGSRVASVAVIPAGGLQQAAQSVVGQNLGAEQPARANRATWLGVGIAVVLLSVVGAVQLLVPGAIARVFVTDADLRTLRFATLYLQVLAYGYWAIGAAYLFQAGFNAASRSRVSLSLSLVQYWLVRLPVAVLGASLLGYGVFAVFWSVTLSNVVAAVLAGGYYYYSTARGLHEEAATAIAGD